MRITLHLLALLLTFNLAYGQSDTDPYITTKKISGYSNKIQFKLDNLPTLTPIPGAVKKPEVKYLWLFGDGEYSFEENPVHIYHRIQAEAFEAECFLTYTYTDDEQDPEKKKRKRKKTAVAMNAFDNRAQAPAYASAFNRQNKNAGDKNAVYLQTNQSPKAGEEFVAILSYRNTGAQPLNGKIKLFYNDYKSCPDCFTLPEPPKAYHDELYYSSDMGMIDIFANALASSDKKLLFTSTAAGSFPEDDFVKENYASRETWEINNLEVGEEHHIFIILKTNELKTDTSLTTPVLVRFEGSDGGIIDDHEMELKLVSSHDPNNVLAKNYMGRMERSFETPWKKRDKLLYRVNFQNNGDGAASEIRVVVNIPPSLDTSTVEILEVGVGKDRNILEGKNLFSHQVFEDSIVFYLQHINLGGTGEKGVNKSNSRGYVTFNIKPKPRKAKRVVTQANIYFDTNEPVTTKKSRIRLRRSSRMTLEIGVQQPQALPDWSIPRQDFSFDNKFIGLGTSALLPKRRLSLDASIRYATERYAFAEATAEFNYRFRHLTANIIPQVDVLPFLRVGVGVEGGVLLRAFQIFPGGPETGVEEFNLFDQAQTQDERYGPLRYGGIAQLIIGASKKRGFAFGAAYHRFHDKIPVVYPFITQVDTRWHNVFRLFVRYKI